MSEDGRKRTTVQDGVGLILSGVGGLFSVSIFLYLLDWRPKEMIWNEPVMVVIDLLGGVPGMVFCLALAVLGTLMFLGAKSLEVGKHSLGIVGATLGLSLAFGTLGGAIGGLIPGMIAGKSGLFLSLTLGLTVLLSSVWVTWFGGVSIPWKPKGSSSVIAPTVKEPEGVSAAEAAALANDQNGVRGLPTPQPTSPAADVRRHGGVPEGAQPLPTDDRYAQDPFSEPAAPREDAAVRSDRADEPVSLVADEPASADLASGDDVVAEGGEAEELSSQGLAFAAEVKPVQEGDEMPLASWETAEYEGEDDELFEPEPIAADLVEEADEEQAEEPELSAEAEAAEEYEDEDEEFVAEAEDDGEEDDEEEYEEEYEEEEEELVAEAEDEGEEPEEEYEEEEEELVAEAEDDGEEDDEDEYEEEYEEEEEELVAEAEDEDEEPEEEYEEEEEELVAEAEDEDEEESEEDAGEEQEEELVAEADEESAAEEPEPEAAAVASDDDGPVQPGLFDVDEPSAPAAPAEPEAEELFVLQPQEAPEPEPEPEPEAAQISPADREQLVHNAGLLILEHNRVAVSMLEREFELDFDQACEILDELQSRGLIGPYKGGRTREILLSQDEWLALAP